MKTTSKLSTTVTLLSAALTFFLLNGCRDNFQDVNSVPAKSIPIVADPMRTEEIHPLQSLAPELYQPINDRYEDYGKLVYHHYKFNPVSDPIEYLPQEHRAAFTNASEKVRKDFEGLSIKEKIAKLRRDEMINDNISALYTDYFDDLNQEFQSTNSAIELWKFLRANEQALMARPNDEGVGNLLVFSSMLRNHIKYNWEVEEFEKKLNVDARARTASSNSFCLFGLSGSCWLNVVTQTVFDAAISGLTVGVNNALNDKAFFTGVAKAGEASAIVNFLKNSFRAYTSGTCGCGATTTYSCGNPTGFRVLVDGCSLVHTFQVIGGGADATNFSYSVQNGYLPEFGNVSNVQFTGAKAVQVAQTNPSVPILLTVTVACSNGTVPSYNNSYDLYAIERNPEPITLSGATSVNFNDPTQWTYSAGGSSQIANSNNTLIWSRNWAGQTAGGGANHDNFLKIRWIYRTNQARVYLQSQNICSGAQASRELAVNVY